MGEPDRVPLPAVDRDGRARFEHDGRAFAVFRIDGRAVVTDEMCPHKSGPLSEGLVRDGIVVCPFHFYAYDLRTGRCRTTDQYRLRLYPVVEIDGALLAEIPPEPKLSWAERLRAHARGDAV